MMMKTKMRLQHKFCKYVPGKLNPGTVYISIEFGTAVHLCVCGCGERVVTPLSPSDWKLIYDGETISLNPSIGNWGFDCQSHYWIRNNKVIFSNKWTKSEIGANRELDRVQKQEMHTKEDARSASKSWMNRIFSKFKY